MERIRRAPAANQRSVCGGKRTSSGGKEVWRVRRTERSGACEDDEGVLEEWSG